MIAIEHNLDSVFHMKERVFILEIFIPVHVSSTSHFNTPLQVGVISFLSTCEYNTVHEFNGFD